MVKSTSYESHDSSTFIPHVKKYSAIAAGVVALLAGSVSGRATLLLPSPVVTPQTPISAFATENPGTFMGSLTTAVSNSAYSATVESLVYRRTAASSTNGALLPAGGLDFYYQITITGGPATADIRATTLSLFDPYIVDAGFDSRAAFPALGDPLSGETPGTQAPVLVSRDGAGVKLDYRDPVIPIDNSLTLAAPASKWLVLRTNATLFGAGNAALIDGFADNARILAPVPEPTTVLFGIALVGVVGSSFARRSRGNRLEPLA